MQKMNRRNPSENIKVQHDLRAQRPTLRELEVLRAVVGSGKTTIAAERLDMSQPAISRILTGLEDRLGRTLFKRANGRLIPTPEAMALDAQAAVIFNLVDNLSGISDIADTDNHIRIAASPTLAHQLLGPVLSKFVSREPAITTHVEIGRTPDCLAAVADGTADIGLVDQSPAPDGVRFEVFRKSRAHVALPRKHRLAGKNRITPRDLADESLIAMARRFPLRTQIDAAFASYRVDPKIVAVGATSAFLIEMVRHGAGLTIINPFPLELSDLDELILRPFDPDIQMETAIVVPASTSLKPAARALANFIRTDQPTTRFSTIVR